MFSCKQGNYRTRVGGTANLTVQAQPGPKDGLAVQLVGREIRSTCYSSARVMELGP